MSDPLQIPHVWRAQSLRVAPGSVVPSGFETLDAALGGGWPAPALIEILTDLNGIGELQFVLPLLTALSHRPPQPALIQWLNPPYAPNAVALAQHGLAHCLHWVQRELSARDTLWAMEQALRSGACSAVLAWTPSVKSPSLRRLKLAVAAAHCVGILYRPANDAACASPANIRARLTPRESQLQVSLLKIQGRTSAEITLDIEPHQILRRATPS